MVTVVKARIEKIKSKIATSNNFSNPISEEKLVQIRLPPEGLSLETWILQTKLKVIDIFSKQFENTLII